MNRDIIQTDLKKRVFEKYQNKCFICEFSVKPALRVHHIIPISLGGNNKIENLVLLCGNCHTLTHYYGSKRYKGKDIKLFLNSEFNIESLEKIESLIDKIQNAKIETEKNGLPCQATYEIDDAVESVARKNRYTILQKELFLSVIKLVLDNIPEPILCSYRLLSGGKYISINLMNYLLFRSPAYGDLGGKPDFDCCIIFPNNLKSLNFDEEDIRNRDIFYFKYFNCINIECSYREILNWEISNWTMFRDACIMASNAKPSRKWMSNIKVSL